MADSTNGTSNGSAQKSFRVIGTRPIRHDGIEKVTGRAKYGADYSFPGMLYGKVLRSPHAHARLIAIRTEKAAALPGVKAIITGDDLPDIPGTTAMMGELVVNTHYLSLNVMARGKVLYDGHAVAAVAATSPHIAEEALRLIEVDYEPLPPVMSAEAAMKPDAPILLPEIRQKFIAGRTDPGSPEGPDQPTNIAAHIQFQRGDLEAGFREADYVVEREFKTATVHQGYIEPQNAVALYSSDGHATIYCSTQGTFNVRTLTATVLKMTEGQIKVVPAEIGGGFGGKTTIYLEPLALLLAQKSGRPVKMTMSRAEVLRASGPTSGTWIKGKMGATRDGKITAAQFWRLTRRGLIPARRSRRARCAAPAPTTFPTCFSTRTTWWSTGPRSRPIAHRDRQARPSPANRCSTNSRCAAEWIRSRCVSSTAPTRALRNPPAHHTNASVSSKPARR